MQQVESVRGLLKDYSDKLQSTIDTFIKGYNTKAVFANEFQRLALSIKVSEERSEEISEILNSGFINSKNEWASNLRSTLHDGDTFLLDIIHILLTCNFFLSYLDSISKGERITEEIKELVKLYLYEYTFITSTQLYPNLFILNGVKIEKMPNWKIKNTMITLQYNFRQLLSLESHIKMRMGFN